MSDYAVAQLDEIEEMKRWPLPMATRPAPLWHPAFGVNVWTGHDAGDRIINEHDEASRPRCRRARGVRWSAPPGERQIKAG
jgi:hypothetical protein